MSAKESEGKGQAQAAALGRVLDAEREAAQRIEAARSEAEEVVAAAKQAARAEAERADRRVQALHHCARKALKAKRAAIDAEFRSQAAAAGGELTDEEIETLVARLARRLTGFGGR